MNPPSQQPPGQVPDQAPDQPPETSVETVVPQAPDSQAPVPASDTPAPRRRAKTEDFAFLARLPARKPETFDSDAILRAAWMVGGLAVGLWIITLIARPGGTPEPVPTPTPGALMQQAAPIVMPGNESLPAPQAISLTPAPLVTPAPMAPRTMTPQPAAGNQGYAGQNDGSLGYGRQAPSEDLDVPTTADTPDPSNLFPEP